MAFSYGTSGQLGGGSMGTNMTNERPCINCPFPNTPDCISTIQFSHNSRFISAGSWDNKVYLWELNVDGSGSIQGSSYRLTSPDVGAPVLDHCWDGNDSVIYIVGCNNAIKAWNLNNPTVLSEVGKHNAPIKAIRWIKERRWLVTGSWDNRIAIWDPYNTAQPFKGHIDLQYTFYSMDVLSEHLVIAMGGPDTAATLLTVNLTDPTKIVRSINCPLSYQVRNMRVFYDRQFFVCSSVEGRAHIRKILEQGDGKIQDKSVSFSFKCHRDQAGKKIYSVNGIDCHPSERYKNVFVTAGNDGNINFWDKEQRRSLKLQNLNKGPIVDIRFNATGTMFAVANSYDWSRGAAEYNPLTYKHILSIYNVLPDDLEKRN